MASPTKPMAFNSPRASPFRRPESPLPTSPSTVRASTPTASSPTKFSSPTKPLSPSLLSDKGSNPFVRRPSQLSGLPASDRPSSPFARPTSRLSVVESPSRALSFSRDPAPLRRTSVERDIPSPPEAADPFIAQSPSPATADALDLLDGAVSSPSPFSPPSPTRPLPMLRPSAQRTVTSSTTATIRPFPLQPPMSNGPSAKPQSLNVGFGNGGGNYNHVPQPLLRSMRESFEVLDSSNSGTITSASIAEMLEQLGIDCSPRALSDFFPPNAPVNLNLARFLDMLSAPFSDMSHPDELAAAFGAFDVDDSGQIDLAELRDALLHTAPEPGAEHLRMSEREVDSIMSEFSARRAFGGKGVLGKDLASGPGSKGRGDVFRYRDFMATVTGGGLDNASEHPGMA